MQVTGEPRDVRDLRVAFVEDPSKVRIELVRRPAGMWQGAGQSTGVFVLRGQRLARSGDAGAHQCGKDP